jgi:hypothetical protein
MYAKQIQFFEDLIHETFEGLGGVTYAKRYKGKFKQAERCGDCCLLDVFRVGRDLMVNSYQIILGKGGGVGKAVVVVLCVGLDTSQGWSER